MHHILVRLRIRQECPMLLMDVLLSATNQEKEIKDMWTRHEEINNFHSQITASSV